MLLFYPCHLESMWAKEVNAYAYKIAKVDGLQFTARGKHR